MRAASAPNPEVLRDLPIRRKDEIPALIRAEMPSLIYPSAVLASSGHRHQRAAHAAHQDVDAIDHVRPLGGVAERAQ